MSAPDERRDHTGEGEEEVVPDVALVLGEICMGVSHNKTLSDTRDLLVEALFGHVRMMLASEPDGGGWARFLTRRTYQSKSHPASHGRNFRPHPIWHGAVGSLPRRFLLLPDLRHQS